MPVEQLSYRLLIVDDDPRMQELIETRLKIAGYRTTVARDGYEALRCIHDHAPNGMLLDINMPRLDGFGVLREMKRLGHLDRTPTMVLTARKQGADVQEAIMLGARDFLTKPFEAPVLLARVARLLHRMPPRLAAVARPA